MAGEMFKAMAGINMLHVPYRGDTPAVADLLGGQVHVYFATLMAAIEYVRAKSLRALAVTTTARAATLPDIPTLGEFLPAYEASAWSGLNAPNYR